NGRRSSGGRLVAEGRRCGRVQEVHAAADRRLSDCSREHPDREVRAETGENDKGRQQLAPFVVSRVRPPPRRQLACLGSVATGPGPRGAIFGRRMWKVVPPSAADSTSIRPPWPSTILSTMNNPKPRWRRSRPALAPSCIPVQRQRHISGTIAEPSLWTAMITSAFSDRALTVIGRLVSPCCTAF